METNYKSRNAGVYSVAEIMQEMERKKLQNEVNNFVLFLAALLLCCALPACGTWEVKFGMSEYNGSSENRTFKQEDRKK